MQRGRVNCSESHSKSLALPCPPGLWAWSLALHPLFRALLATECLRPHHFLSLRLKLLSWKLQGFHKIQLENAGFCSSWAKMGKKNFFFLLYSLGCFVLQVI